MNYWLLKTEPEVWSWDMQVQRGIEPWDGVRNREARNNMRDMKLGDECFFYHTGKERKIIGLVEVVKEFYSEGLEAPFGRVDVKTVRKFSNELSLTDIKKDSILINMEIIRKTRLSVAKVKPQEAEIIFSKVN